MLLLVNGNKWAGFTVFLMFHVCTMLTATRGEGKFMSVHSISNDTAAEQQGAKLTCCLPFPCKDSLLPILSGEYCFGGQGYQACGFFCSIKCRSKEDGIQSLGTESTLCTGL